MQKCLTPRSTGRADSWLLLGEPQRGAPVTWYGGRLLSKDRDGRSGSGPGLELHAPKGCRIFLTGHDKVEVAGLEPAHDQSVSVAAQIGGKRSFALALFH